MKLSVKTEQGEVCVTVTSDEGVTEQRAFTPAAWRFVRRHLEKMLGLSIQLKKGCYP